MNGNTIEQKVAGAILGKRKEVFIGGKEYEIAPPSIATLILVSEAISRLPRQDFNPENIVQESLNYAKHSRILAEIVAIIILGAKRCLGREKGHQDQCKWSLKRLFIRRKYLKCVERLTDEIVFNLSPRELNELFAKVLKTMELSDFFGLTTFLNEINLLQQTKVEN